MVGRGMLRVEALWLCDGQIPGCSRRNNIPAVLPICCRVPAGGPQSPERLRDSFNQLGLAQ